MPFGLVLKWLPILRWMMTKCVCGNDMFWDRELRRWLCPARFDGARHRVDHAALSREHIRRFPKIIEALRQG